MAPSKPNWVPAAYYASSSLVVKIVAVGLAITVGRTGVLGGVFVIVATCVVGVSAYLGGRHLI